jgi:hypothetical protein
MPQNQPREIGLGAKKGWDFLVRALHKRAVPDKSKDKDETKRGKECDREFFPVHDLFRVEVLVKAHWVPKGFMAKRVDYVDPNLGCK